MIFETPAVYHFAVLRAVPHVHRGEFVNVGVLLHSRTAEFLGVRALTDVAVLHSLVPALDTELLARYLTWYEDICKGMPAAGPLALLPLSERFHWLSAPCSDVLQSSPVHEGLCRNPEQALEELFSELVASPPSHEAC